MEMLGVIGVSLVTVMLISSTGWVWFNGGSLSRRVTALEAELKELKHAIGK